MVIICPHNDEVDCATQNCASCGWNPEVAKARVEKVAKSMSDMKLYKVPFTGYCEVWARSQEEAVDAAEKKPMFFVHYDFGDAICLEKEDANEMD